jgi:hypothetical protein
LFRRQGEDNWLWGVDIGEGKGRSDLTQSVPLVLGSLCAEGTPCMGVCTKVLGACCRASLGEPGGQGCLAALPLLLSSGTGWITPPWLGFSTVGAWAGQGTGKGKGMGMGMGTGSGTMTG